MVEYGSIIWSPYQKQDIRSIESIQRFFSKKICFKAKIYFTLYQDRLHKLNIKSLQYRRVQSDLLMTYKIIHKLVDLPMDSFFEFYKSPYNTRSHDMCLKSTKVNTEFQRNFFSKRVIPVWNKLPRDLVASNSYLIFRTRLRRFDISSIIELEF